MKHIISFLLGAALLNSTLAQPPVPPQTLPEMTNVYHFKITTNWTPERLCVPLTTVIETNWMVMPMVPQHQRPPELDAVVHTEVGTVTSNIFARFDWVDSQKRTNNHYVLLESKVLKKIFRSFQMQTERKYLEEAK